MKTVGIVGGIGPESTIAYYRSIIRTYRERAVDGSAPSILIDSIDVDRLLGLVGRNELKELADYLSGSLRRLASAGADFAAMASNTPHIVFDEIRLSSPLPLVSIVESAADAARSARIDRVSVFGTRYTMTAPFYADVFSRHGIEIIAPAADEISYIHSAYVNELLNNQFLPETHARIMEIVESLRCRADVEAVVLGGTELSLLIRESEHAGVRFLDTTEIHVERIVERLLA